LEGANPLAHAFEPSYNQGLEIVFDAKSSMAYITEPARRLLPEIVFNSKTGKGSS